MVRPLSARRIRLGATIDGNDAALIERVVPLVDVVEITPDRWASFSRNQAPRVEALTLDVLAAIAAERMLILHGVGLSIASHDSWNDAYIGILDQMFAHPLPIAWHSEHLSFARVDGEPLGTMVEPPWTREALDLVAARINTLQARCGVPFLMEHVARAFPEGEENEMNTADFLNRLCRETGCGILLDVYNLECDHYNFSAKPSKLLDALDLDAVREIHVAGGVIHNGYKVDIHSRTLAPATLALLDQVLDATLRVEAVIFEVLGEAIPSMGLDVLASELTRLRGVLDAHS
jgi:uncharacterized protein (UPF0276 family)